jgi:hypothetical protein
MCGSAVVCLSMCVCSYGHPHGHYLFRPVVIDDGSGKISQGSKSAHKRKRDREFCFRVRERVRRESRLVRLRV